jgi:hypothetical protein
MGIPFHKTHTFSISNLAENFAFYEEEFESENYE